MILTNIYRKIKEYNTIIIHRHVKPDGDALGSQIGLKESLLATFPNKCIKVVGDMSERYSFIGEMDEVEDSLYENALVIVLDTGAERLISDERYKLGKYLIKIDHHLPQGEYGDLAFVDTSRESCAGVVASFLLEKRFKINDKVATALFTGMVTDSGRFMFSLSEKVFETAAILMKNGANYKYVYDNLYSESLFKKQMRAYFTSKIQVNELGFAHIINTR